MNFASKKISLLSLASRSLNSGTWSQLIKATRPIKWFIDPWGQAEELFRKIATQVWV